MSIEHRAYKLAHKRTQATVHNHTISRLAFIELRDKSLTTSVKSSSKSLERLKNNVQSESNLGTPKDHNYYYSFQL